MLEGVALLAIGAAILLPALHSARERGRQASCLNNLKQIGSGIHLYAADNQDHFPPAAGKDGLQLIRQYINNERVFRCPSAEEGEGSYAYYGAGLKMEKLSAPGAIPLVSCHNHNGTEIFVVYADVHVKQMDTGKLFYSHEDLVKFAMENADVNGKPAAKDMEIILQNARKLDGRE